MGESLIEQAIGEKILAIPGIELGYCARPGEVEVRVIGEAGAVAGRRNHQIRAGIVDLFHERRKS